MSRWYDIRAEDDGLVIWLYDEIGDRSLFGESDDVRTLVERITRAESDITVRINSPGGSVWDGAALHAALAASPQQVTVYVDGLAASIASYVAMAGDRVVVAPGAMLMVHDPWGAVAGTAEELRELADVLDKVRDQMARVYAARTGRPVEEVLDWMRRETWFSAEEAVAVGLADEVGAGLRLAALAWDLAALYGAVPSGALPYRALPLAGEERAWDAGGAVSRVWEWAGGEDGLDPERFSRAFLYRTPGEDPKTRAAYKLPIADVVDGELVAVPRGIFAAAAVLQGARGGPDMPEDDIRRCRAHLSRYYERMGRTAPWDAEDSVGTDVRAEGRVLSAANYERIEQAHRLLGEVLEAARSASQPEGGAPEGSAEGGAPEAGERDAGDGTRVVRRLWSCGLVTETRLD